MDGNCVPGGEQDRRAGILRVIETDLTSLGIKNRRALVNDGHTVVLIVVAFDGFKHPHPFFELFSGDVDFGPVAVGFIKRIAFVDGDEGIRFDYFTVIVIVVIIKDL